MMPLITSTSMNLGDLNVTGDSALQSAGDLTVIAAVTSNGADLFLEADSPHAGAGSNGVGSLILEDDTLVDSSGGDIVLMGAAFDFANAMHVTSGAGDTFIAPSTNTGFTVGGVAHFQAALLEVSFPLVSTNVVSVPVVD